MPNCVVAVAPGAGPIPDSAKHIVAVRKAGPGPPRSRKVPESFGMLSWNGTHRVGTGIGSIDRQEEVSD